MSLDLGLSMIIMQYVCLLFSLCVHEAAHAAMATYYGDLTARMMGRLTLNPLKHIDPIGTVLIPLLMFTTNIPFLIGWAKPVPFIQRNLTDPKRGPVFIALAGPASNIAIALVATLVLRAVVIAFGIEGFGELISTPAALVLLYLTLINLGLALFNCLPIPPLDGHYVLDYFLPPRGQEILRQIGPFGVLIAILIGGKIIGPPLRFLYQGVVTYALNGMPLPL